MIYHMFKYLSIKSSHLFVGKSEWECFFVITNIFVVESSNSVLRVREYSMFVSLNSCKLYGFRLWTHTVLLILSGFFFIRFCVAQQSKRFLLEQSTNKPTHQLNS